MADTQTFKQQSFTTEVDPGEGYKRLSRLAVWSIPMGLLSALSLISPLLWIVPVIAIAFALGGLWVISRSDDTTGRRLALTGLGLAILFGTWGMSWTLSRQMIIARQSREHASEWLGLMQEQEYMKAHQLSLDYFSRLPAGASLATHYAQQESGQNSGSEEHPELRVEMVMSAQEELVSFQSSDLPKVLVAAQGEFEFKFVKNLAVVREGQFATKVNQVFHLTFSDEHEPREMDVQIEMKRTVDKQHAYWQVARTSDGNKPS